jgi:hypothetical protein
MLLRPVPALSFGAQVLPKLVADGALCSHDRKISDFPIKGQYALFMTDASDRKLSIASPEAQAEARTQADEYDSLFGNTELELDGGATVSVPPHPDYGMLDDDKMEAWDELRFEVDTVYDREPDIHIPEQTLDGGLKLNAETQRGALKVPYRKGGALVKPAHSVKVVQIALGEAEYKRLRDGGRNASDVWKIWGKQSIAIKERQQRDSKSS